MYNSIQIHKLSSMLLQHILPVWISILHSNCFWIIRLSSELWLRKHLVHNFDSDAMNTVVKSRYVKPPIFTLCVGNAWGEAALLLSAGAKGNRSALPSSTIMIKQVYLVIAK